MKITKQKKGEPGRTFSPSPSSSSAGRSGFTDNRPLAQAQAKTIQVIQRVGGPTSGYNGSDVALHALLKKGREVNKIKKECITQANLQVLNGITNYPKPAFDTMVKALKDNNEPLKDAYLKAQKAYLTKQKEHKRKEAKLQQAKNDIPVLQQQQLLTLNNLATAQTNLATAQINLVTAQNKPSPQQTIRRLQQKVCQRQKMVNQLQKEANRLPLLQALITTRETELLALQTDIHHLKQDKIAKYATYQTAQKQEETRPFEKYKEGRKTNQVKEVYTPQLKDVSLSPDFLKRIATVDRGNIIDKVVKSDEAAVMSTCTKAEEANKTDFDSAFGAVATSKNPTETCNKLTITQQQLDEIKTGEDAFQAITLPQADTDRLSELHRQANVPTLYTKKGKDDSQYIKDDLGNFVRRYAYMEKNFWQLMNFMETGYLSGETQAIKKMNPASPAIPEIDPAHFEDESLQGDEKLLVDTMQSQHANSTLDNQIAVAYLHQWKGSGKRQRGVSLTATPKENAVFGNAGESFRNPTFSAKFKIDLFIAKTKNQNTDPDNLLMSHYAPDSPTRKAPYLDSQGLFTKPTGGDYRKAYKYEASMIKNRELYLQYVDRACVAEIQVRTQSTDVTYKASEIDKIKDEIYYKNYIAGKSKTPRPKGEDFSLEYYGKGIDFKNDFNRGLSKGKNDFKNPPLSDENAIFTHVFNLMSSQESLPYWQGLASGLFKAWQEQQAAQTQQTPQPAAGSPSTTPAPVVPPVTTQPVTPP